MSFMKKEGLSSMSADATIFERKSFGFWCGGRGEEAAGVDENSLLVVGMDGDDDSLVAGGDTSLGAGGDDSL
jgi:hypothetical protein